MLRRMVQLSNLEKNNFSQYGGWILNQHQGRHSMYTRDREGISEIPAVYGARKDKQAASCGSHITFGHGPLLENVNSTDLVQR
jgi:hypothetical protein